LAKNLNIRNYICKGGGIYKCALLNIVSYFTLFISSFISWNYFGFLFFINGIFLFAIIDKYLEANFFKFITHSFLFILSWKLGALSWMFYIDKGFFGFLIIFILSLIPFILLFFLKKIIQNINIIVFIFLWFLYELFNNFTNVSFPWLTLGNVFSTNIYLVQWYKYTGILGGSLWFLLVSYFLYCFIKKNNYSYLKFAFLTFVPLSLLSSYSFFIKKTVNDDVLIDKTFITFNNEKISDSLKGKELAFYIYKITKNIESKNKVLLIPESTFRGINMDRYDNALIYNFLKKIITQNGFKEVYFGTTMYKPKEYISNASIFITEKKHYTKVKEKLIMFNEYVPKMISSVLNKKNFNPYAHDTSDQILQDLKILPLICYEAFYSYYVLEKNKDGKLMYLLSSEKFLNNSFWGSNQYNNILKLRCVENEMPLIKSSNNGNSLVINSKGEIIFSSREELNIYKYKN
jgi:apolipoprotein N-acyltransferase